MTDTEIKRRKAICEDAHVDEIDDVSDGFHTFRQLYYQRMILFAAIVKQNKDKAWKSLRHEDGELCFGGGWFIVGVDTPEGNYTYHYEDNYYSLFDCKELERGKHWDGHTEKDVTRLLSLPSADPEPLVNESRTLVNDLVKDTISRQAAIDALMEFDKKLRKINWYQYPYTEHECRGVDEAIVKIANLPSAQPEQTDCEYCHEDFDGYVRPIEKNSHAWLVRRGRTMQLRVCFKGGKSECDILFCPMCGRRLTDG